MVREVETAEEVLDEAFGANTEWWNSSSRETYKSLARTLLQYGLTVRQAAKFLSMAYGAAADEFGG